MPQYRNHVPPEDAVRVSRLKAVGAVVLGKTNVPLGLQDIQSFNDIYGTTNNPWDHGRTAGGSSGGSEAALACGFGALSIGSDVAGSLRTPAHFCGGYAHKPTLGPAANRGMVPPPAPALPSGLDLAVVGPMVRTARDLTLLLDLMAGYPYLDQLVWAGLATMRGLPATAIPAGRSPEGLPVGVQLFGPMFEDRNPAAAGRTARAEARRLPDTEVGRTTRCPSRSRCGPRRAPSNARSRCPERECHPPPATRQKLVGPC
ncbi:hypothetical protein GCM10010252_71690 [Streptomyces aureoverticillatus]|nr:hypothetical protein GCM10010252_71690 [Streptomyces aureoverticillatus]